MAKDIITNQTFEQISQDKGEHFYWLQKEKTWKSTVLQKLKGSWNIIRGVEHREGGGW